MRITINNKTLPNVKSATIKDFLSGKIDESEITIVDPSGFGWFDQNEIKASSKNKRKGGRPPKWFSSHRPMKGDKISIFSEFEKKEIKLGDYILSSWTIKRGEVILICQSADLAGTELRKARSQLYEKSTLRGIVSSIAQRNKLELFFDGDDYYPADMVRQSRQSDLSFLVDLADCCGFWCKVWGSKLIFRSKKLVANIENYGTDVLSKIGAAESRITIQPSEIIDISLNHKGQLPEKSSWRHYKPVDAFLDNAEFAGTGNGSSNNSGGSLLAAIDRLKERGKKSLVTLSEKKIPGGVVSGILAATAVLVGPNSGVNKPESLGTAFSAFPKVNIAGDNALEALLNAIEVKIDVLGRQDISAGSVFNLKGIGNFDGVYLITEMNTKIEGAQWRNSIICKRTTAATFTGAPSSTPGKTSAQYSEDKLKKSKAMLSTIRTKIDLANEGVSVGNFSLW